MATITLEDVVKTQELTNVGIEGVDTRFQEFFAILRADRLDMLEQMQEKGNSIPGGGDQPSNKPIAPEKFEKGSFGGIIAAVTAMLSAQALGFAAGLADSIKKIGKVIFKPFTRFLAAVDDVFGKRGTGKFLKGDTIKTLGKLREPLQKFFGFISNIEKWFGSIKLPTFGAAGGFIDKIKMGFESIKAIFSQSEMVGKFINTFKSVFGKVFSFFRVLGRAFLPLTAIIEVGLALFKEFSTVMADENSQWLDYVKAGIKGILKGLGAIITMPLDLLKDGVSWILEKLGMEEASKWLDSFSFTDMFGSVVDFLTDLGVKIAKFPVAIGAGGYAALGALAPGGESPLEAFSRGFKEVWNGGESNSSLNVESGSSSSAGMKTEAIAQGSNEAIGQQSVVVVNNNVNAPSQTTQTSVSNSTETPLPPSTNSGSTRADAYA